MLLLKPRKILKGIIGFIGELLAFFAVFFILFMVINARLNFLPHDLRDTLLFATFAIVLVAVGFKGFEFALRSGIIISAVFIVILIAFFILLLQPGTLPSFMTSEACPVCYPPESYVPSSY